jgi:hypothetical protein
MRGGTTLSLATGLCFLMSTACFATTAEPVSGDLQLNRPGHGFQKVSETTVVEPGDLLMVSPNGTANVFYPDGCKFVLQPGSVLTVAKLSPCAAKSFAQAPPQNGPPGGPPPPDPAFGGVGAWGFGAATLGLTGFVGYEIYHAEHTTTAPRPASP